MKKLYPFLIALLLCGCHPKQSGNFGIFFTQQVSKYGGHVVNSNSIPELLGTWDYKSDTNGFETHLSEVPFSKAQYFMQQVYGSPIDVGTNSQGQLHGLYKASDVGVAIQFFGEQNGVSFICLRAQTNWNLYVH